MKKRIRNKKAKQEINKFVIRGEVIAYFINPELSKMMQERQDAMNDAIKSMLVDKRLL